MNIYFALLNMENWSGMATGEKVSVIWVAFVIIMVIIAAIDYSRTSANSSDNIHDNRQDSQRGKEQSVRIEAFVQYTSSGPEVESCNAQEEEKVSGADVVADASARSLSFEPADAIKPGTRETFRHNGATGGYHATGQQVNGKRISCIIKKLGEGQRKDNHEGLYEILLTIRQSLSSE